MPLTFDATPGGAAATSFVSVVTADAILAVIPGASAWVGLDDAVKEQRLMEASAAITGEPYAGRRATTTQRLAFPRTGLRNAECGPVPDDAIPAEVEQATARLALLLQLGDASTSALRVGAVSGIGDLGLFKALEIGPLKLQPASTTPTDVVAPVGGVPVPGASLPTAVRRWLATFFRPVLAARVSSLAVTRTS